MLSFQQKNLAADFITKKFRYKPKNIFSTPGCTSRNFFDSLKKYAPWIGLTIPQSVCLIPWDLME